MTHPAADISQPHLETPAHSAAHSRAPRRTAGQAPLRPPRGPLRPRQLRDTAGGAPAPCLTPSPAQPLYLRSFASEGNAGALEYQPDVRAQQRSAHRPHTEKPTAPHPARTTARYFFLYPPLIELRWKYRENGTNSRTYAFVFSSSPRPPPFSCGNSRPFRDGANGRAVWKGAGQSPSVLPPTALQGAGRLLRRALQGGRLRMGPGARRQVCAGRGEALPWRRRARCYGDCGPGSRGRKGREAGTAVVAGGGGGLRGREGPGGRGGRLRGPGWLCLGCPSAAARCDPPQHDLFQCLPLGLG